MRSKNSVLLLLGTNLGNREDNLKVAKAHIKKIGEIIFESKVKETKPVDFTADLDFYNQILLIKTLFSPVSLLKKLKQIEAAMGRVYTQPKKGEKYTSRIIDIDILYFNKLNFNSKVLNLPHSQVFERIFVAEMLINIRENGENFNLLSKIFALETILS